jgi:hypothetical protein
VQKPAQGLTGIRPGWRIFSLEFQGSFEEVAFRRAQLGAQTRKGTMVRERATVHDSTTERTPTMSEIVRECPIWPVADPSSGCARIAQTHFRAWEGPRGKNLPNKPNSVVSHGGNRAWANQEVFFLS